MPLTFEEAVELQDSYRPADEGILRKLATITIAPHVGPSAVGKNYFMARLNETFGYYQAGNVVSRELRPNDPPNVRHVDERDLLEDIEKGRLVQFAAFLGNRALYATNIEDYREGQVNTKDVAAHAVDVFTTRGFKAVRPVCLLAPPEVWRDRLDKRFATLPPEQQAGRLEEAAQSIQWILEGSPSIDRVMIIGNDELLEENLERVKSFVENEEGVPPEQIHFDTAEKMLQILPELEAQYLLKVRS